MKYSFRYLGPSVYAFDECLKIKSALIRAFIANNNDDNYLAISPKNFNRM